MSKPQRHASPRTTCGLGAIREGEDEVDLFRQLAPIKRRHIVDIFPIALSNICGQIFQRRHLAQVRRVVRVSLPRRVPDE